MKFTIVKQYVWWNENKTSRNCGKFEEKDSSDVNFSFRYSIFFFLENCVLKFVHSSNKYNLRYYNKYNNFKKVKYYKIKNVSIQQIFKHNFQCFIIK